MAAALISYPLHPPGKPGDAGGAARRGLLTGLAVPAVAVRGDRDPFAAPAPWAAALAATAAAGVEFTVFDVPGGDHALKRADGGDAAVQRVVAAAAAAVAAAVAAWVEEGGGVAMVAEGGAAKGRKRGREG